MSTQNMGVQTEEFGPVLRITLDRPKANAINTDTSRALAAAFMELRDRQDLRVGIITGSGRKFFSAGWDLKAAASGESVTADHGPGGFAGLTELFDLNKPVIAAVNGLAVGGGFELALACDIIIAAEHASFFLPEPTLGIIPDSGGVLRLPRVLPRNIANEMLLTGRRMSAHEAHGWGLVNLLVSETELPEAALKMANQIADNAPLAVQAIKQISRGSETLTVEQAYHAMRNGDYTAYIHMLASADAHEGITAYSEGRAPVWQAH